MKPLSKRTRDTLLKQAKHSIALARRLGSASGYTRDLSVRDTTVKALCEQIDFLENEIKCLESKLRFARICTEGCHRHD